jgi:DNA-binding LacI/PurR family transcriptional regulator
MAADAVLISNFDGGHAATSHLTALGHRRIACITGNMHFGCGLQRLDGYRRALEEAGIPFDPALVRHGDFSQPAGYVCAQELLALSPRPTAIFASSDPMAMGVYTAAYEAGLSVPDQLSVVGFNDTPEVLQMRPQLTTVHQPIFEMGGEAVRLLQQLLDAPAAATPIVELPTHLVVRQSTAAPGHAA